MLNIRPNIMPKIDNRIRNYSYLIIFFIVLFISSATWAVTSNTIPSREEIQNELNILNKRSNLTEEDKLSIADLEKAVIWYDEIDKLKKNADQLQKKINRADSDYKQALNSFKQFKLNNEEDKINYENQLKSMSLHQLELELNELLEKLQTKQEDLASYNSQLVSLQTQPERAQAIMLDNARYLQDIRSELNGALMNSAPLRNTQIELLQIEQYYRQQQNDFQKRVLQANTQLQDVLQKQRDYAASIIEQLEHRIQSAQSSINDQRLGDSEETAREVQSSSSANPNTISNPLIQKETASNQQLSERLISITQENNRMVQNSIRVNAWLERATQAEQNLKEQINVLRGSLLLSRILFQEQINLPPDILTKNLPNTIADLRLEQFDVNQQRDALYQTSDYIKSLEVAQSKRLTDNQVAYHLSAEEKNALEELLDVRRDLLDQLNSQLGGQISQAINLQLAQKQLLNVITSLEETLAQQIFWVNSNKPMNLTWLAAFPSAAQQELESLEFTWSWNSLQKGLISSLPVTIPLLFIAFVFIWLNKKVNIRLQQINSQVKRLSQDNQLNTPQALLLTLIQTLPTSLIAIAIGYWFLKTGDAQGSFIWAFFQQFAIFWVLFEFSYRVVKSGGIAEQHFAIDRTLASRARRQLANLAIPLLPLIYWSTYGINYPLRLANDVIGQLVVSICLLMVFIFTLPFCRDVWKESSNHLTRSIIVTLLTFSPLILIGLMMAGYYYTTLRLANRWVDSLYLLLLWYIVYNTCLRGLTLAARKLAYQRAIERREMQSKEDQENEPIKEPAMSIDLISQQSLRLTTMTLFFIFTIAFYAIWSDFITILSFLNSVTLWNSTSVSVDGGAALQAVTLADFILALVIIGVAWVMTRNLPGLLEVLVLSRLKLRQGSTYAITTLLTYIIIGIGTIASMGALGVTWNKLQWLAAALTFGLGFGLQEIFANFVSGIILLFERPIRIGDTVTIGTYSGTVSKIRIRATTITDFDSKEVIIPNKAFVTERLINWSLSDTVTRITVALGVAYGSDLDKVKQVLLRAATENANVMRDPAPGAYFTGFGASTLDHELRFYVRQIGDRGVTTDEVNRAIDKLCRENQINIAFNQLEVHLHNAKGEETQEIKRSPNNKSLDNGNETE